MFKGRNKCRYKNITYPKHFSPYLSSQIDKKKDKKQHKMKREIVQKYKPTI